MSEVNMDECVCWVSVLLIVVWIGGVKLNMNLISN